LGLYLILGIMILFWHPPQNLLYLIY